ncbi:2-carboxy-1,4-naphthoquinone phytyltransferase [Spirulina sp. CCNP1310]|uniref:2-carboxy-1,4-naphthoquinone phytyltransferase n=1 Tax=Spirulina sp. CCNP1310 TaxID=3110249 RepID=UPI002B1F5126|nr:2-carboxy-1,4-naphthoquinone phytyltransferase [Spirulina sp. CCNP1310]MEA5418942.1 2-carboxy-1,4-naphthoquinone phytyltransferase [Spirulina sp. CCNP1310]
MTIPVTPNISTSHHSRRQLWWAAIKLPMYSVAVIPIALGTAIAYRENQQINGIIFSLFLWGAIAVLAWINLSNDVFDAETGIDENKAHSVVNLTQKKALIFWLSLVCLVLGVGSILWVAALAQDWRIIALVLAACSLGYAYQGPPFRWGYLGLGEPICFITFGPMAIAAALYSQGVELSALGWAVAVFIGFTTTLILFCSHFHQVADDLAAGKRSPIVRLGTARGASLLTWSLILCFGSYGLGLITAILPLSTGLIFLTLPIAWQLIRQVQQYHDQPEQIKNCKFIAVKLHFWSGLLLMVGLLFAP